MSGTHVEPEKLRPELHQRIDQMDASQLELLHRVVLKLELEQVVGELHSEFDAARTEGSSIVWMKSFAKCASVIHIDDGLHRHQPPLVTAEAGRVQIDSRQSSL